VQSRPRSGPDWARARRSPRRATSCWSRPATPSGAAISTAAHATLTRLADRERGVADSALDFWSELLALLRCEPLPRIPAQPVRTTAPADPWDGLRRLAQIERVRLAREGRPPAPAPAGGGHLTLGLGDQQMVWPVENELWTDEFPTPAVVSRCPAAEPPHGDTPDALAAPARPPVAPEVALVSSAARQLPAGHPAKPLLLVQAAVLNIERGDATAAAAPLSHLEQMTLPSWRPTSGDRVVLASALAAVADPAAKPDTLLVRGRAALSLKTSAPARRALSLLLAQRLFAPGAPTTRSASWARRPTATMRWAATSRFKQMEAHARAGRRGPLLAEAREVLARRAHTDVEEDPTSTAVMDIALRTLLASPGFGLKRWRCSNRWVRRVSGWAAPMPSRRPRWKPARSDPRWRRSCGCTRTTTIQTASCRIWRARPSPPRAPATAPSSRARSACSRGRRIAATTRSGDKKARQEDADKKADKKTRQEARQEATRGQGRSVELKPRDGR
jgi:hypothetical protein